MIEISVIVPIYNTGNKLNKCIKSILKQTYKNFELILVNDGSTDNSLDICKYYSKKDNRIKIIDKKNEGTIKTRQRGISESNGKYITFVDSDDYVDEKMLEILHNEIVKNSCDIVVCDFFRTVGKIIKKRQKNRYFENEQLFDENSIKNELICSYLYGDGFSASLYAKLYKAELFENIGKYSKRINFVGDDLVTNIEIFLKANKVKVIKNRLYYYTYGGGTSRYMKSLFDDIIEAFNIQKEVADSYFKDGKDKYPRISFMLLNSYRCSLENLFHSNLSNEEIENKILKYVQSKEILEACRILKHHEVGTWFKDKYFIEAIEKKDTQYLFSIGKKMYNKLLCKRIALKILCRI